MLISFFGSNKNDPSDQEAVRQKTQEIQRIIEQSKKNPAVNWEEQRRQQEFEHNVQMEQERRAAMQRIIAETPKKPMPAWVDDGIDVNSLPKPTVHIIPMRKWDDSSEPYEAPKYILPSVSIPTNAPVFATILIDAIFRTLMVSL